MKNKMIKPLILVLVFGAGILICFALYYFMDRVLNGTFVDWFENHYMVESYWPGMEGPASRGLNWPAVKRLCFGLLVANLMVWLVIVFVVSCLHAKTARKATITQTSQMIRTYLENTAEASSIFPSGYAEISAQMVEIKSQMQRHEQLLRDEAARKNDLITYLAHDLKTPLTSVIGYLSLLREADDMPTEQRKKYIQITLDKANRLEILINEFFEITRYNLQQIYLEKETIDLYYMMVQMTDEFYPILHAHGNTAQLHVDEDLRIYGDAVKLARVFNNILKNAIAYSYPNTAIRIWAEQTGSWMKLYFQNRGKCIPQHKLETIFEKFYRLDEARATNTGGAGLGLAIAKEIVTLHGGSITATSDNEVTTFCVSLPLQISN